MKKNANSKHLRIWFKKFRLKRKTDKKRNLKTIDNNNHHDDDDGKKEEEEKLEKTKKDLI